MQMAQMAQIGAKPNSRQIPEITDYRTNVPPNLKSKKKKRKKTYFSRKIHETLAPICAIPVAQIDLACAPGVWRKGNFGRK